MSLTPLDFPCPRCRAAQGAPCVSLGGAGKKAGEPTTRPHDQRTAQVPSSRPKVVCGTKGGYQKHLRNGTPTCEPCREANAAWRAQYRKDMPREYAQEKRLARAQTRALWRMAREQRETFRQYVADEMAKDGAA